MCWSFIARYARDFFFQCYYTLWVRSFITLLLQMLSRLYNNQRTIVSPKLFGACVRERAFFLCVRYKDEFEKICIYSYFACLLLLQSTLNYPFVINWWQKRHGYLIKCFFYANATWIHVQLRDCCCINVCFSWVVTTFMRNEIARYWLMYNKIPYNTNTMVLCLIASRGNGMPVWHWHWTAAANVHVTI